MLKFEDLKVGMILKRLDMDLIHLDIRKDNVYEIKKNTSRKYGLRNN